MNSIVCLFLFLCLFFVFEFVCWDPSCLFGGLVFFRTFLEWIRLGAFGFWVFLFCFCSESLILAQDERWRRA